LRPCRNLRLK